MEASIPTTEWNNDKNARRCHLIDKDLDGKISDDEKKELAELTTSFLVYRHDVAPLPIEGAQKLLQRLLDRKDAS